MSKDLYTSSYVDSQMSQLNVAQLAGAPHTMQDSVV